MMFGRRLEYLEELRLRLRDLIEDIPQELGNKTPEWTENSIFYLWAHMIWAEQQWIKRAVNSQYKMPEVVDSVISPDMQFEKGQLIIALDSVGEKITHPYLKKVEGGECVFSQTGPFEKLDELLQHLCWHYSYHSGQIGMLRRFVQQPYQWNFG
jgi:uncharacterized damage-inducible protein DinB